MRYKYLTRIAQLNIQPRGLYRIFASFACIHFRLSSICIRPTNHKRNIFISTSNNKKRNFSNWSSLLFCSSFLFLASTRVLFIKRNKRLAWRSHLFVLFFILSRWFCGQVLKTIRWNIVYKQSGSHRFAISDALTIFSDGRYFRIGAH